MRHYESAERWNRAYPVGTCVRVHLSDGHSFQARTASVARQWGALALLRLEGSAMVWTISALQPLPDAAAGESCDAARPHPD